MKPKLTERSERKFDGWIYPHCFVLFRFCSVFCGTKQNETKRWGL